MRGNRIVIIIIALAIAGTALVGYYSQSPRTPSPPAGTTTVQSPTFSQSYNLPSLLGMAIWATATPAPFTPTPTNRPNSPTPTPTNPQPTSTSVPTHPPNVTPTTPPVAGACSAMDNGLPNATMHYPGGSAAMPSTTREICAWNSGQYYALPYRNPNCRATQSGIDAAARRIPTFYNNLDRPNRLFQDWRTVQDYAVKYNFNPIFVLALWIEESGASGVSYATKLGCDYRLNKNDTFTKLPANSTICEQMECLFGRRSVVPQNYALWACQYRHGASAWTGSNCTLPVNHTKVLEFWYNEIARGSSVAANCYPKYFTGAHTGC